MCIDVRVCIDLCVCNMCIYMGGWVCKFGQPELSSCASCAAASCASCSLCKVAQSPLIAIAGCPARLATDTNKMCVRVCVCVRLDNGMVVCLCA